MPIDGTQPNGRRRARRRYARWAGVMALALLIGGAVLTTQESGRHDLGVAAIGYGLGVGVAAVLLASGWEPRRRK